MRAPPLEDDFPQPELGRAILLTLPVDAPLARSTLMLSKLAPPVPPEPDSPRAVCTDLAGSGDSASVERHAEPQTRPLNNQAKMSKECPGRNMPESKRTVAGPASQGLKLGRQRGFFDDMSTA